MPLNKTKLIASICLVLHVLIMTIYKFTTIVQSAHTQKLIRLIKSEMETCSVELGL